LELKYALNYQNTDGPRMKTDPPGNNSLLRVYVRICSTDYIIVKRTGIERTIGLALR